MEKKEMIQNAREPSLLANEPGLSEGPENGMSLVSWCTLNILIREFPDKGEFQRAEHEHPS
jgi:hypothetical protein